MIREAIKQRTALWEPVNYEGMEYLARRPGYRVQRGYQYMLAKRIAKT